MPKAKTSSKGSKPVRSAEELKRKIDEERAEWDRHENHGSSPAASSNCMRRIEALQKELKESHGLDY